MHIFSKRMQSNLLIIQILWSRGEIKDIGWAKSSDNVDHTHKFDHAFKNAYDVNLSRILTLYSIDRTSFLCFFYLLEHTCKMFSCDDLFDSD